MRFLGDDLKRILCLLLLSFNLFANPPNLLSFGGGLFEVVRQNKNTTGEFRVEWRPGVIWHTIRPTVGFLFTIQGSTYLYGGFGFDWVIGNRFLFSPNFAIGWYGRGGGKDLGYPVEFRSGIEIGWQFPNYSRFGAHFYHLSNASLSHRNPGVECLDFFFAIPL